MHSVCLPTTQRLLLAITLLGGLLYLDHLVSQSSHGHAPHPEPGGESGASVSFVEMVQPVLSRRCVVCHSCFDAPCQLKLSSPEGIERGANKQKVYEPKRLKAMSPTRLFVDATSTREWRAREFYSVVDNDNKDGRSLMHLLLDLKREHPQPTSGPLPDSFTLDLDREQVCSTSERFEEYAEDHPLWGMPYGMPELSEEENRVLLSWLEGGAVMPLSSEVPSGGAMPQIRRWEDFLNGAGNKQILVSRYIYEHLFHAHIHFSGTSKREFYRLVRSTTPPGEAVQEIPTVRPYDDPGREFHYRLRRFIPTIVAKNHIVYEFSDARLGRYKELFLEPKYEVPALPSYAPETTANPFKVFASIPPESRYRFLLDEARFFIEGFIKGPVCRGQIALNVIEDRFWVMFFDPEKKFFTTQADFLDGMADYLRIPSERGSHLNLLPIWTDYWKRQKAYMMAKQQYFEKMNTHSLKHAMSYIWDGGSEEHNPNAALTVFRHFDSASVEFGFVGEMPETAWVIDYPLFERIHYLLVAGYNVYGNVGHQLSTRIYMDFLRMEGEDHFLAFLPVARRKEIRDQWYQGIRKELNVLFDAPMEWMNVESVIGYTTDNVRAELLAHFEDRLGMVLGKGAQINLCGSKSSCGSAPRSHAPARQRADAAMNELATVGGLKLHNFPEVSYVRVVSGEPGGDFVYSMLRNKAYKNVLSLFSDERVRDKEDIEQDTLTVVDWLVGNYPNFFFQVDLKDIEAFTQHCASASDEKAFDALVRKYGVRRTDARFWPTADWFQDRYASQRPIVSGLYDLSRYSNL